MLNQQTPGQPKNQAILAGRRPQLPAQSQTGGGDDPFLYASLLTSLVEKGGPFGAVLGEVNRMLHFLTSTRHTTQNRIKEIERQTAKVANYIEEAKPKDVGHHLDRLR